jgi:dTDP-4-dehydrorhamnose 3,5-epimerase
MMRFEEAGFADARLIVPEPVNDERGSFMRTFCVREWASNGLATQFDQHSTSYSRQRGTLRGLHFQAPPFTEIKVVRCLKGAIFDVIVDLRAGSPTLGGWRSFELTESNRHQLYIPAGFAHGFQALTDNVEVAYLISQSYVPEASRGVPFNDPAFKITWPLSVTNISQKDLSWPAFDGQGLVL